MKNRTFDLNTSVQRRRNRAVTPPARKIPGRTRKGSPLAHPGKTYKRSAAPMRQAPAARSGPKPAAAPSAAGTKEIPVEDLATGVLNVFRAGLGSVFSSALETRGVLIGGLGAAGLVVKEGMESLTEMFSKATKGNA